MFSTLVFISYFLHMLKRSGTFLNVNLQSSSDHSWGIKSDPTCPLSEKDIPVALTLASAKSPHFINFFAEDGSPVALRNQHIAASPIFLKPPVLPKSEPLTCLSVGI